MRLTNRNTCKIAKLEDIKLHFCVGASYTNPVHSHGSFTGFSKIQSKDKGEKLCLKIMPYISPSKDIVPAFGNGKITIAENETTFYPNDKVKRKIVRGKADYVTYPEDAVKVPDSINKGKHIFHMG